MTRDEALAALREIHKRQKGSTASVELGHVQADQVLLDLIGDEKVTAAYGKIWKWYS